MAPPPLPVNLRCHLPTNGCDRGSRRTRIAYKNKTVIFSNPNDISVKETTNCGLWREDGIQQCAVLSSSSGPAEGYAVKKTKNKVGEWVNRLATTARLFSVSITPLQFHPSDLWENREFWGVWTRNLIFTHTSNGWRAIPATNTRREAHDWDLNFKRSLGGFFVFFFNCECGSCGL